MLKNKAQIARESSQITIFRAARVLKRALDPGGGGGALDFQVDGGGGCRWGLKT